MTDWADVADLLGELSDSDDNDGEKKPDLKESCIETSNNGTLVSEAKAVSFSTVYFLLIRSFIYLLILKHK